MSNCTTAITADSILRACKAATIKIGRCSAVVRVEIGADVLGMMGPDLNIDEPLARFYGVPFTVLDWLPCNAVVERYSDGSVQWILIERGDA